MRHVEVTTPPEQGTPEDETAIPETAIPETAIPETVPYSPAVGSHAAEPEAPGSVKEAPPVVNSTVRVSLVAPWWTAGYNTVGADGSKIAIDRKGVLIANSDVDRIVKAAAKSGITLKVGK